jgi:hypothetical protein
MFQGHYARFIRFWIRIATTDRRAIAFLFLFPVSLLPISRYCQFLDKWVDIIEPKTKNPARAAQGLESSLEAPQIRDSIDTTQQS